MTELISWNVNGLRAILKKGLVDFVQQRQPDILCLQETKIHEAQVPKLEIPYPHQYYHSADKAGYSSTAILTQQPPLAVDYSFPDTSRHPQEGRVQAAEFEHYFVVNVYVPNSQDGLRRLDYRTREFDADFRVFLKSLARQKPVIVCGDFNVAHEAIDLARPEANRRNAGFTDEERASFSDHLAAGFVDTFRRIYPAAEERYTWWSYRGGARSRNVGWRIDYVLVTPDFQEHLEDAFILDDVMGSDHCPVGIKFSL